MRINWTIRSLLKLRVILTCKENIGFDFIIKLMLLLT